MDRELIRNSLSGVSVNCPGMGLVVLNYTHVSTKTVENVSIGNFNHIISNQC